MRPRPVSRLGICAVCISLLLAPATAAAQSLLEAWAFADYRGIISLGELQTAADGSLTLPDTKAQSRESAETWIVIDASKCVLRKTLPSGDATEYYLNNISATRPTMYRSDDIFQVGLMGNEPIRCRFSDSDKQCDHFFRLEFTGSDRYRAGVKALDHIYAHFCRYAR